MSNLIPDNYNEIVVVVKQHIQQAQYQSLRVVNQQMIHMYWQIGKLLNEQSMLGWGKSIVEDLSKDVCIEYPGIKGSLTRNLGSMKQFYEEYMNTPTKLQQLVAEVAWGQNLLIMTKVKEISAKEYYLTKCKENGWSRAI